jgi:hypothetical protein
MSEFAGGGFARGNEVMQGVALLFTQGDLVALPERPAESSFHVIPKPHRAGVQGAAWVALLFG